MYDVANLNRKYKNSTKENEVEEKNNIFLKKSLTVTEEELLAAKVKEYFLIFQFLSLCLVSFIKRNNNNNKFSSKYHSYHIFCITIHWRAVYMRKIISPS